MVQILREKDVVASLTHAFGGHPLVVKLYCTFQDPRRLCMSYSNTKYEYHFLVFVFNHAKNGELYELLHHLGKFDEKMTLFYITEICEALFFIHRCRIVHRDLKPENILLGADWHIIISDFGSAKLVGDKEQEQLESEEAANLRAQGQTRGSFVGTAQYVSPEVLQTQLAGYEADFWAVGAILYQMLTGLVPFRANNEYHIMRRVMNLQYEFPEGLPEDAKDLVGKFLVLEPEKRYGSISMGGPDTIKSHPYFKTVDWSAVTSQTPPNFTHLLPKNWAKDHEIVSAPPDLEPGLSEDAVNRMMGFGKYASESEPPPLTQEQLNELKLAAQRNQNVFHKFVKDNLIIKFGFIDKKKGLFARRRMFLLTEGPHLFYVDPVSMELRGEVPFTKDLRVEAKNFRAFFIHVPGRTYILFDPERNAKKWCDAIDDVRQKYFGDIVDEPQPCSSKDKKTKKKEEKKDKKR
uniref:3-phosphoinositide-dependent protein kinase 1 n=1 Tax=Panagrolaimus sp. JU765 TaxID=591449 RepID=A0AC34QBT9_9BILA